MRIVGIVALALCLAACGKSTEEPVVSDQEAASSAAPAVPPAVSISNPLVAGEVMGLAYSGFREGQHPDRGDGANNPSRAEILEDLRLLQDQGFRLLRLYDSGENSALVLELIREEELPFKVLLGAWLDAELSNHEGCPWLDEPIPDSELAANTDKNRLEISRLVALANDYRDIVVAVNVGNEALVSWTDHLVAVERVIDYVQQVQGAIAQPVTVAENYEWWAQSGADLAAAVDFLGVHTYPIWESLDIEDGLSYTEQNIRDVRESLSDKPLAILEAGWASTAIEFGDRASEAKQHRYYDELRRWAELNSVTVFFFEAFDEPWKGNPAEPLGAEKHWGLYKVDRTPKQVLEPRPIDLYAEGAVAWAVNVGGDEVTHLGVTLAADDLALDARRGSIDQAISGVQDPALFSSYREGEMRLQQALPDGRYDITLFFTEPAAVGAGGRLIDIHVQGELVIPALDVLMARDGNLNAGLTRTVTGVEVTDGSLRIDLKGRVGTPVLSGLLVRSRELDTRSWELTWSDEFNTDGAPDPGKWNIEIWDPRRVNDEDQAYTDRPRNVRVEGGRLVLEAHRETYGEAAYTSGRIQSAGKGDWLYGRVDIRARLPGGQGTWPALWMMPTDSFRYATTCSADSSEWEGKVDCDAWPNSGEIDIMEHVGYDMTRLHGTVHTRAYYWKNNQQRKGSVEVRDLERAYHVYSLVWTPDYLTIYFEGVPYFRYENEGGDWKSWPFDHPYHMIFNLAVGGNWGRAGGPIDDSIFPVSLEVDYVRIFRPAEPAGD